MKIQLKNKSARIVIVSLDELVWGILPRKILPAFLRATEEAVWDIDSQQGQEIKELIREHVWAKLLDYLAYRERSSAECRCWMHNLPCHPQLIASCLEQAQTINYLNDERFAEVYTESLVERQKSEREIRQKLYEKGIESWLIDRVITEHLDAEKIKTTAEELVTKKWHSLHMHPVRKRKEKVLQYMMRKGFKYDDVVNVIRTLIATEKGHDDEWK